MWTSNVSKTKSLFLHIHFKDEPPTFSPLETDTIRGIMTGDKKRRENLFISSCTRLKLFSSQRNLLIYDRIDTLNDANSELLNISSYEYIVIIAQWTLGPQQIRIKFL